MGKPLGEPSLSWLYFLPLLNLSVSEPSRVGPEQRGVGEGAQLYVPGTVMTWHRCSLGSAIFNMSTFSHVLFLWVSQRFLLGITNHGSNEKVISSHLSRKSSWKEFTIAPDWLVPWWPRPGREKYISLNICFMEMLSLGLSILALL